VGWWLVFSFQFSVISGLVSSWWLVVGSYQLSVKNLQQSWRLDFVNRSKRLEFAPPKGGMAPIKL